MNGASNEEVIEDHSMELLFPTLGCHPKDEFRCVACRDDGFIHYEVPPFVSKFTTVQGQEHVLAVADEDGLVTLVDSSEYSDESIISRFRAHRNAIFDLCWVDNEKKFVTASGDQKAILWDVPTNKEISVFEGHKRSIKSVHFRPRDTAVFATGARDGDIMIWDTRSQKRGNFNKADNVLRNAHCFRSATMKTLKSIQKKQRQYKNISLDALRSVTTVLFQDDNTLLSTGTADGLIKVWDLRKNYSVYRNDPLPKYSLPYAGQSVKMNGYSNLAMNSSGTRLFASCTDNVIYQFNCASYEPEPVSAYFGFINDSFFVKAVLCPREKYILSGSTDSNACIWRIDKPGLPIYQLVGHSAEVTSVDWCKDPHDHLKLVTCCDDSMVRIWRPHLTEHSRNTLLCRCNKFNSNLELEANVQNPNFWMSKLKSFAKYGRLQNPACESSGDVGQGSSKSSDVDLKRLRCTVMHTPKTMNVPDCDSLRSLRPKRPKLAHCTVTPPAPGIETPRKSENAKRTLTGKCLFSDEAESDELDDCEVQSKKMPKTSITRSPFKNITGNENSQKDSSNNEEYLSPTCDLPNSVTDKHNIRNQKIDTKKRSHGEHWLSKLSKKRKKANGESKHSEKRQKKLGTNRLQITQPIKKYFSTIAVGGI